VAQDILNAGIPLIFAETGDMSANGTVGAPVISDVITWADQHGASVLAGTWDACSSPGGNSDLLIKHATGTPTDGEGVTFKDWLAIH
jgi:hypothetical protein